MTTPAPPNALAWYDISVDQDRSYWHEQSGSADIVQEGQRLPLKLPRWDEDLAIFGRRPNSDIDAEEERLGAL